MKLYSRRRVLARAGHVGRVAIVVGFGGYMDYFLFSLLHIPQYLGLQ